MPNHPEEVISTEVSEEPAPEEEQTLQADAPEESAPAEDVDAEEASAEAIRADIENALRTLGPPTVPWRVRLRFNTDGSIDMEIGSSEWVRGLCPVCDPCCCDPW